MRSFGLIRNFLYLSGAEVASKLVTFVAVTYLARVAGPVGFGYIEFAGAVLVCAGLIVDQGFGTYGAREIAKEPANTATLLTEIVAARSVLALIAYAGVAAFALALGRSAVLTQLLLIYGLSLVATPFLLQWIFQGHNHMRTVASMQLIRQTIFAMVVVLLVRDQSQIWGAAVAEVVGATVIAGYGVWIFHRRFHQTIRLRLTVSRRLLREGVPIGLSQMLWMIRMSGATVIVGIIASAQDVGYFGAAMRILIALHAFVWLYYFNLLPSLSRAWQDNSRAFGNLVAESLHGVAWIAVAGGLVWVVVAPTAATAIYGQAFAPAGPPLQWLAGVCVVAGLSGHYRFGLIAGGKQTAEMVVSAIGAMAALFLIPIGYVKAGPSGAAIGLLATELVVWWCAWWWSKQRLGVDGHVRYLLRPLVATAFALTLLRVSPLSGLGVEVTLVVLSLAAAAFLLEPGVRNRCYELGVPWHLRIQRHRDKKAREVA